MAAEHLDSEGTTASPAPDSRVEESAAPSERPAPDEEPAAPDEEPAAPGQEPIAPAGEPEAPVGPTTRPEEEQDADGDEDHEAKVEHDLEELAAKAQKADEYLELAQRTRADFENYRKRAARDAASAQDRGVIKLAKELLPAVDNLDRALAAAEASSNGSDLVSGIKLVHADVISALARVGIEPFSPQGEPFDPTCHEAIAQQPCEGSEPGTVVEVYQCGYRLGENVLRPARVVVAG